MSLGGVDDTGGDAEKRSMTLAHSGTSGTHDVSSSRGRAPHASSLALLPLTERGDDAMRAIKAAAMASMPVETELHVHACFSTNATQ
jgi:hypothetical protein